ncbi:hypothetical protein EL22_24565 [Halostagnicola sp. A56]|uniref:DUF4397 domain-containing protein n=1 Tax=Halostagnicola sp. A56 TaxID=1495067 RepID=UPI0004A0A9E1|nr:DUF4397 domain-containing protein [Halostagnicola sp. A56]KDE59093.1 hypothetical protein EL22_24565 [Halostagnicola sp. A56]
MVRNHTRRRVLSGAGAASVVAIAGCLGGDEGSESDTSGDESTADDGGNMTDDSGDEGEDDESMEASVRVAHLSPDAPNVDVSVDGEMVLEDVPYRTVSEYLMLEPGTYEVMIAAADDPDTVVFDEELEIGASAYTVAALGELAAENQPFEVAVLEDDRSSPGEDACVRLVHASPDAPAVDVTVGDGETVLFEDVGFGETATAEVAPGEYTLEVRPATSNNDGEVVGTFDIDPAAGNVYSAFAVGYLEPADAPADEAFDLEVVVDAEGD